MLWFGKKRTEGRARPSAEKVAALEAINEALNDKGWYSRYLAALVLVELGAEAQRTVPRLIEPLDDPHEWVREAAGKALDSIDPMSRANHEANVARRQATEEDLSRR